MFDAIEKVHLIRGRLKDSLKSLEILCRRKEKDLDFEVGDVVYLKISPIKGVKKFCKKGKP